MKYDKRLYPFQREGVRFIQESAGRCILGDEIGLGKTVQTLCWLQMRKDIGRTLVVAPANVIFKWKREIETWTTRRPQLILTMKGIIPRAETLICSYTIMAGRFKELRALDFDLVIWDEAHYLKGNRKKTKRVAASLQLKSPFVLFLTGTPFLNRPIELFNLLDMAQPGKWSLGSYGTRYCGGFDYWEGPLQGAMNLLELQSRLKSVMIRRLKREVLTELPKLQRVVVPVVVGTAEYKEALKNLNRTNAMTKIMDAWHVLGREKAKIAVEWTKEFFEQSEPGTKLVLYAHHLDVMDYLDTELRQYGTFKISGEVPPAKRDALILGFQSGASPRIAIINKAGGEGIDLFGVGGIDSSNILFVERQWTPALEMQAEGRLDRIGQTLPVTAYYLSAVDTFDTYMEETIAEKRAILGATIKMEEVEIRNDILKHFV